MSRIGWLVVSGMLGLFVVACAMTAGGQTAQKSAATQPAVPGSPSLMSPADVALTAAAKAQQAAQMSAATPAVGTEGQTAAPSDAQAVSDGTLPGPAAAGVSVGSPLVVKQQATTSAVFVPVMNPGPNVKSLTVKATWKSGDQVMATASGSANDVPPGGTKVVGLAPNGPLPGGAGDPEIEVAAIVEDAPTTSHYEVAKQITFGPSKVTIAGTIKQVDVEVTNTGESPHTLTIQAVFMQGNDLAGIGTGAVNDIAPGQTKAVTLVVQGEATGDPQLLVDTVMK